jgi:hypothetical protein
MTFSSLVFSNVLFFWTVIGFIYICKAPTLLLNLVMFENICNVQNDKLKQVFSLIACINVETISF